MYQHNKSKVSCSHTKTVLFILTGILVLLLSACGAGGDGATPGEDPPPGTGPDTAGALRVELKHLPEELTAEVSISGPENAVVVTSGTHEFTDLPAGNYIVNAAAAGAWFVTGDRTVAVEVKEGETASVNFAYDLGFGFNASLTYFDDNDEHWFGWSEMPTVTLKTERPKHVDADAVEVEIELPSDWTIDGAIPSHWDYAGPDEVQLKIGKIPAVPQGDTNITATFTTTVADQDITQQFTLPVVVKAVVYENSDDARLPGTLRWLLANEGTVGAEITFDQETFNTASDTLLLDYEIVIEHDVTITGFAGPQGLMTIQPREALTGNADHRLFVIDEDATVQLAGLKVTGGYVRDNRIPHNRGGAIYNKGVLTLSDVDIRGNHAYTGGGIYAVSGSTVTVDGGAISGNKAKFEGGGIYANSSTVTIVDGVVSGNEAEMWGGGIYADGSTVTIVGGVVSGNEADEFGGGIYAASGSTVTIVGGVVSGNEADEFGGGIYAASGSTVTINGGVVSGNRAKDIGGGIVVDNSTITLRDSEVIDNTGFGGGGILASSGSVTIDGGTVSGNKALSHVYGGGGGIAASESVITITSGTVSNNKAETYGGGIAASESVITITSGTVSNNKAETHGGGIHAERSKITIRNSEVLDNQARTGGGAMHIHDKSNLIAQNSSISNNQASEDGGGITVSESAITMTDGAVSNNVSGKRGGGIWAEDAFITIIGGDISENEAWEDGGAIYAGDGSIIAITGESFSGNKPNDIAGPSAP